MAEIDDDLVPTDGLTNSNVRFIGLERVGSSAGAEVRFEITGEDKRPLATYSVFVEPQAEGTLDAMVREAHRKMRDVLRQWLFSVDRSYQHYSRRTDR